MQTIALGNEMFEGRNNAYLLDRNGTVALVDPGLATEDVRKQLGRGLADGGYALADVDLVIVTHWHPDHSGLAGVVHEESGARVFVHGDDAPLVRRDEDALSALRERQHERFEEWGMPPAKRDELLDRFGERLDLISPLATAEEVEEGDRVPVGDLELVVRHASGHTAGLCCFEFDGGREAFVGDAVLPEYTPNVGGADVRLDRPLERYLGTLRRIAGSDYARIHPGHRDVIDDPTGRAEEIITHHRDRTERVVDVLREHGPADAWTVSAHLFGDLRGIHVLHGPGEAYAHLDHLDRHGVVEATADGYALLDPEPSVGDLVR